MSPTFSYLLSAAATLALTVGCTSKRAAEADELPPVATPVKIDDMKQNPIPSQGPLEVMPKVILYKTSGDYLNNVPVQLNADGTLLSFPAPTDIPANATPIKLKSGWLISPVGVGKQTVFTTYTYDEYRNLKETPTPEEILKAVIPGSRVTIAITAPMTLEQALADPDSVDCYLSPTPRQ